MAMKYEHVISHPVDLRESNLVISQLQERRDVIKVIGGLSSPNQTRAEVVGIKGQYQVRREHVIEFVVNHCP
jgi:hypothetical protein